MQQTVVWQVQKVNVYADDGTAIKAYKAKGDVQLLDQSRVSRNRDGSFTAGDGAIMDSARTQATLASINPAGAPFSGQSDCHGTTFASGQVWINDDQVQALMKGDGYNVENPSTTPTVGAVGIYSSNGDLRNTVHSVLVDSVSNRTVQVISKGGISNRVVTTPDRAWRDPNAKLLYYTKRVRQ